MKLILMMIICSSLCSCLEKTARKVSVYETNKVAEYPKMITDQQAERPSSVELSDADELDSDSEDTDFAWNGEADLSSNKIEIEK